MQLATILNYIIEYRYFLIIPLTIAEGPIVMILCGFLLRLGTFDFLPLYFALMLGDLIGDIGWYCVGRFFGLHFVNRFGKFFSITEDGLQKVTNLFQKYHNKILFISKITTGFGLALLVLITAGISKVPFKKYLLLNVSGQFIWTGMLLAIGFFFGNVYVTVDKSFRDVTLVAMILFLLVVIFGLGRYVNKKIRARL